MAVEGHGDGLVGLSAAEIGSVERIELRQVSQNVQSTQGVGHTVGRARRLLRPSDSRKRRGATHGWSKFHIDIPLGLEDTSRYVW